MLAIALLAEVQSGGGITWMLWVALGFFGLMVLVGWLSSRRQKPEEKSDLKSHDQLEEHH